MNDTDPNQEIAKITSEIEQTPRVHLFLNRGLQFLKIGKFHQAVSDFTEAIRLGPKDFRGYLERGSTYLFDLREYEKAIEDFSKVIEFEPKNTGSYICRGNSYDSLGEYEKSVKDYTTAISLNPQHFKIYNDRGHSYTCLKEYDKAVEDFSKSIDLNPGDHYALRSRANVYYRNLNNLEAAISDFTKLIELVPQNNSDFYCGRGTCYLFLGNQHHKAEEDLSRAIELNPKHPEAYHYRGILNSDLKNLEKSIDDYTKHIQLNPFLPELFQTYNNRGTLYNDLQRYRDAIDDFTRSIEINPLCAESFNNRGFSYGRLGEPKKAMEEYTKAIDLDPFSPSTSDYYYNRGRCYGEVLGEHVRAIEDYDLSLSLNDKNIEAYNNRGNSYRRMKQYTKAIEDYTKAICLSDSVTKRQQPKYLFHRGLCLYLSCEYEKSIDDFNRALALEVPKVAVVYYLRGLAFLKVSEPDKSSNDIAEAKIISPEIEEYAQKVLEGNY